MLIGHVIVIDQNRNNLSDQILISAARLLTFTPDSTVTSAWTRDLCLKVCTDLTHLQFMSLQSGIQHTSFVHDSLLSVYPDIMYVLLPDHPQNPDVLKKFSLSS